LSDFKFGVTLDVTHDVISRKKVLPPMLYSACKIMSFPAVTTLHHSHRTPFARKYYCSYYIKD